MRNFNVSLVNNGILHSSVNLRMSKYFLNLLNWHSFIDCPGSHSSTKFMRMNFFKINFPAKVSDPDFDTTDLQSVIGSIHGNKKSWIVVCSTS